MKLLDLLTLKPDYHFFVDKVGYNISMRSIYGWSNKDQTPKKMLAVLEERIIVLVVQ